MSETRTSEIRQAEIRDKLIEEIEQDLVGPRLGENEVLHINPKSEYLAGVFYPGTWEIDEQDKIQEFGGAIDDEDNAVTSVANDALYKPSSFGLTCRLSPDTKKIVAHVKYGRYQAVKTKDEKYYTYLRTPLIEKFDIPIQEVSKRKSFENNASFFIEYKIIKDSEHIILDFYVVNEARKEEKNSFYNILFQPKIILESVNGENCFIEDTYDVPLSNNLAEDEHLSLLFYKEISFGKGHLCAVTWDKNNIKDRRINKIETTFVPKQMVDKIEPSKPDKKIDAIYMKKIANCSNKKELRDILEPILTEYENWINDTEKKIQDQSIVPKHKVVLAEKKIKKCRDVTLPRIRRGIDAVTSNNDNAFEALKFANLAIAWQQTMAKWAKENAKTGEVAGHEPLEPENKTWRLFQITFILMNIDSIVNPTTEDRETVDLLWFPTGGGKTEAYLGLVAFVIAYRRLRGKNAEGKISDKSIGTSVLMRYTLRLLTVQQFQRAATLMCACEKIRLANKKQWGDYPFQVGLWVGGSVTPNKRDEGDHSAIKTKYRVMDSKDKDLAHIQNYNPYILINCPWCGKKLHPSNGEITGQPRQWRLFCGRTQCMFSKHLDTNPDLSIPVVLIDDDVYSRCPSLVIATVDKFAQITWKSECGAIFGRLENYCQYCGFYNPLTSDKKHTHPEQKNKPDDYLKTVNLLPPELIIQDELHLISGPLGSMAGLYETAIEDLCTDKNDIKPKIIASTATTRAASDQISKLFNREKTEIFPPQLIEFGNTFFSKIENSDKKLGKIYVGILATGKSNLTVLARVSAVILRRIRQLAESGKYDPKDLDPYFTLVSYFNSQRELGGASMNFKDSVPRFISRIKNQFESIVPDHKDTPTNAEEITVEEAEVEEVELEPEPVAKQFKNQFYELETEELTSRKSSGEIPEILRKLENEFSQVEKPVDLLLATNMLSVGVDIQRLGVMIVNGQPKNHSEYIQATGRIGRANPGLIITLYSYTKPRDLSHYENFNIYHSTFYKNVETVALTPFTIRCRQIALFGVFVGLLRMKKNLLSQNDGASRFDPKDSDQQKVIAEIKNIFENRVKTVDPNEQENTLSDITNLMNSWTDYKKTYQTLLKYAEPYNEKIPKERRESYWYLLKSDPASKRQLIPTPTSLRNTEQEQRLFYLQREVVKNDTSN